MDPCTFTMVEKARLAQLEVIARAANTLLSRVDWWLGAETKEGHRIASGALDEMAAALKRLKEASGESAA